MIFFYFCEFWDLNVLALFRVRPLWALQTMLLYEIYDLFKILYNHFHHFYHHHHLLLVHFPHRQSAAPTNQDKWSSFRQQC